MTESGFSTPTGLRIDESAAVLDTNGLAIRGLYAAGETVGGLFYGNYPGGTGLASGSVFGRRAGRSAAAYASRSTGPSHVRPPAPAKGMAAE